MRNWKIFLAVPSLLLAVFVLSGCSSATSTPSAVQKVGGTANYEQDLTEANQSKLLQNQPPPKLDWSLERDNLIKRTNLWNDPNKISYIYLINYGKVMAFYTIKGKVSSVNSQITNTEQLTSREVGRDINDRVHQHDVDGVISSPSEDGSYGTNGNAIFFFTTEGAYVEYAGDYMLADQPLKLTTQPELVRQIQ